MTKTILQQLLLAVVSLLVMVGAFLALEFALRTFAPQPPRGFSDNLFEKRDGLTFLIPGAGGTQYGREFSVSVEGNGHGYRSGTWGGNADIDSTLWLFGDSFPFGWGVEARQSISALINQAGIRCVNFGMPGDFFTDYTSRLDLAIATGKLPTAILLLVYDNDFHLRSNPRWSSAAGAVSPPGVLRMNVVPELGSRELLLKSHLIRLIGRALDKLGLSRQLAALTGYKEARLNLVRTFLPIHRRSYTGSEQFAQSRRDFREFIGKARGVTSRVEIIRIQPLFITGRHNQLSAIELLRDNPEDYDFSKLDDELSSLCARAGAGYRTFKVDNDHDPLKYFFRYDMHLTPAGHRLLANFSLDALHRQ